MDFNGRSILITGGAMGIGRATANRLAADGAHVIVADINEDAAAATIKGIADAGGQASFAHVDLASPESIEQMGREVAGRFDALHGLVNNAGIVRSATVEETGDADWDAQMAVNLRAPALCARALLPLLKAGPGHIVNISSEAAFEPSAGRWAYCATKAAICALTRTMAWEFGEFGMRVNTVAPGWTVTEMHFLGHVDEAARKAELEGIVLGRLPIKRLGRPDEIAAGIVFLLSDDASYITATTLHVDGGQTAR